MIASPTVSFATTATPFVKWAGGKRSLLETITEHAPKKFGNYHEPFVGGGAVFFKLTSDERFDFERAYLNDTNTRLMATYTAIRDDVDSVVRKLRICTKKHSEEFFYATRNKRTIDSHDNDEIAAWMIYLNKTCFNGLYRVNKKNEFNTPWGKYVNPTICDQDNLRACSYALRRTRLSSVDFALTTKKAVEGDFVYFDPPYMPRLGNEFVGYGADHFGLKEHTMLRDLALELKKRGVHVMISNSGADEVRTLYKRGFKIHEVKGKRSVGATWERRGHMPDLLIQ